MPAKSLLKKIHSTNSNASATGIKKAKIKPMAAYTGVSETPHHVNFHFCLSYPYYPDSSNTIVPLPHLLKGSCCTWGHYITPQLLIMLFVQQIWLKKLFWRLGKFCMHFELQGTVCTAAGFEPSVQNTFLYCHKKVNGIQQLMSHKSCSASGCKDRTSFSKLSVIPPWLLLFYYSF